LSESRSQFSVRSLTVALRPHGLILRSGFTLEPDDGLGEGSLIMVGNAGSAMWDAFKPHIDGQPGSLDRWTKGIMDPLAARFGARAIFPFDRPHPPFQRWAKRAEGLHSSPLGLLIHPEYGLWHAYRAALVFPQAIATVGGNRFEAESPCDSCPEKPCLSACPVGAFTLDGYDVPACGSYLASPGGETCNKAGCAARNACPVGREFRYSDAQIRFHMAAFSRTVT